MERRRQRQMCIRDRSLAFVAAFVPETKGKTLEEMSDVVVRSPGQRRAVRAEAERDLRG